MIENDGNADRHDDPAEVAERQLNAYNAKDLGAFVAQYAPDVREYRPPRVEPFLSGLEEFERYYGGDRFSQADLRAEVVSRLVVGNKVVDHERIHGIRDTPVEGVAVYEVVDGLIANVWFFSDE